MADDDDTPANAPVGAVGDEAGALEGDADSQWSLGLKYEEGEGCEKDQEWK